MDGPSGTAFVRVARRVRQQITRDVGDSDDEDGSIPAVNMVNMTPRLMRPIRGWTAMDCQCVRRRRAARRRKMSEEQGRRWRARPCSCLF